MIFSFSTVETALLNSSFFILFLTTLFYWLEFLFFKNKTLKMTSFYGLCFSEVLITFELGLRWISSGHFPLSNLYESLLFLIWSIIAFSLYLEIQINFYFLQILITPIALFILAFTGFVLPTELQQSQPLVPALQSNWLFMHVTVMMLSYSSLLLGAIFAITLLILSFFFKKPKTSAENEYSFSQTLPVNPSVVLLKSENPSLSLPKNTFDEISLPEKNKKFLDTLDSLSYRTIGFGFCCLTLGILSGAVWANETWGNYWSWDPKETWALITWLTFAVYLHTRLIGGWNGLSSAWIACCGFFIIWICYLGVNLLGHGLHSYGFLQF